MKGFQKSMGRIGFICLVIICAAWLASPFFLDQLAFAAQPTTISWRDPDVVNIGTEQAPISAILKTNAPSQKIVLFSYGNAEDAGDIRHLLEAFERAGINAMAYDYPGYGLSHGKPTEKTVYAAADAAYRYLTEQGGYQPENIIVVGRSIGSGPATYLAAKYPVGGLVILSGFTSMPRVVTGARLLPTDPFPNISRIGSISAPKLFIHGTDDRTISISHGKKLYDKASEPKQNVWVEGAGHNDVVDVMGEDQFIKTIIDFANKAK